MFRTLALRGNHFAMEQPPPKEAFLIRHNDVYPESLSNLVHLFWKKEMKEGREGRMEGRKKKLNVLLSRKAISILD